MARYVSADVEFIAAPDPIGLPSGWAPT